MTNLLQENIKMKSPRTNSTFGFFADTQNDQPEKNQKSYFLANARTEIETEKVILETKLKDKNIDGNKEIRIIQLALEKL